LSQNSGVTPVVTDSNGCARTRGICNGCIEWGDPYERERERERALLGTISITDGHGCGFRLGDQTTTLRIVVACRQTCSVGLLRTAKQ